MASATPSLISVRVLDTEGQPVAGARVLFTAGPVAIPDIAALTDGGGSAVLVAPAPGAYELQIVADGFLPQTVAIAVSARQSAREIVLQRA